MLRGRISKSVFFFFPFFSLNIHRFKLIQLCVIHLFESAEFTIRGGRRYGTRFKFEKALTFFKRETQPSKSWLPGNIVTVSGHTRTPTTCSPILSQKSARSSNERSRYIVLSILSTCIKITKKIISPKTYSSCG